MVTRRSTAVRTGMRGAPLLMVAMAGLPGCAAHAMPEQSPPVRFFSEVREMLAIAEPSPEYYRARTRLEDMGPEVDAVLVLIARDPEARPVARANALMLLADRRSPAALPVLRRTLLTDDSEAQRAAAVLALQRLLPDTPEAVNLIRSAVGDPARTVRLNALQALDIRDVEMIRSRLEHEQDPDVRRVALQLVSLAEARGAPLAPDRRGALRTAGVEGDPQIVFRPVDSDPVTAISSGDMRVELPNGPDIPLAPLAEVVAGVVPAFFSPDRSRVVFEVDREIRVVDLRSRDVRSYGRGVAPRPVPFSNDFIFLRPLLSTVRRDEGTTELTYAVYRAAFGGDSEHIGEIQALARPGLHGNYSPARWMVVAETPDGFVLRGEGLSTFKLPASIWNPAESGGGSRR